MSLWIEVAPEPVGLGWLKERTIPGGQEGTSIIPACAGRPMHYTSVDRAVKMETGSDHGSAVFTLKVTGTLVEPSARGNPTSSSSAFEPCGQFCQEAAHSKTKMTRSRATLKDTGFPVQLTESDAEARSATHDRSNRRNQNCGSSARQRRAVQQRLGFTDVWDFCRDYWSPLAGWPSLAKSQTVLGMSRPQD